MTINLNKFLQVRHPSFFFFVASISFVWLSFACLHLENVPFFIIHSAYWYCDLSDCPSSSNWCTVGALRHSLQDRLSKGSSGRSRDQIYLKLRTSTGQPSCLQLPMNLTRDLSNFNYSYDGINLSSFPSSSYTQKLLDLRLCLVCGTILLMKINPWKEKFLCLEKKW